MTHADTVSAITNDLFELAERHYSFRQWFYPRMIRDYSMNPALAPEIERRILAGETASQIVTAIFEENR